MKKRTRFLLKWIWLVPLLIWFVLTIFANNNTPIETEDNLSLYGNDELIWEQDFTGYEPAASVIFGDDVGKISWSEGVLEFEGDAEESAKIFFEAFLKPMIDGYIASELKKGNTKVSGTIEMEYEAEQILFQITTTGEFAETFRPEWFLKVDADLSRCLMDNRLRINLNGEIYWIRLEKDGDIPYIPELRVGKLTIGD